MPDNQRDDVKRWWWSWRWWLLIFAVVSMANNSDGADHPDQPTVLLPLLRTY